MQEGLVVLNETFHSSAGTVDLLVEKLGCPVPYCSYDIARVGLAVRDLGFVDDPAWVSPGAGLIIETGKETNGFSRLSSPGPLLEPSGAGRSF